MLGAIGYLLFDIAVLWACLRAVGVSAPILAVVVGYQVGYLANLIPIPGGLGVLEGGLLAALVLYGLPAAPTAAAVVLYHAIALWIPTLGGTYGFARLRQSVSNQDRSEGPPRRAARETSPSALQLARAGRVNAPRNRPAHGPSRPGATSRASSSAG